MRRELKYSMVAIAGTAAAMMALWGATRSLIAQPASTYKAPRTADNQPDLNGFWQTLNTANWDLEDHGAQPAPYQNLVGAYLLHPAGFGVVEGGAIPYKPEALATRRQHFEKRLQHDPLLLDNLSEDTADPEAKCFQVGVPRATYVPFPFQILQDKDKVLIAYKYGASSSRVIHLGEDLDKARAGLLEIDSPMGQSVGRWEGDTLVVDVRWFSYTPWLDRAGNFMSRGAKVTERYTPISPHHLMYEATIDDPDVFTSPWKMTMPLYRRVDSNMQLLESQCIPFVEEFLYGTLRKRS